MLSFRHCFSDRSFVRNRVRVYFDVQQGILFEPCLKFTKIEVKPNSQKLMLSGSYFTNIAKFPE